MPKDKVSALRGGMGEMLLRTNCVRDRQCEICDFESECIVQRTLYSKFEKKPNLSQQVGVWVMFLNVRITERILIQGETLDFYLILFGKTIVYFNQYVQALHTMGNSVELGSIMPDFGLLESEIQKDSRF